MKCIIIDDEEMCRLNIRHLCSKVENLSLLAEFANPAEALPFIQKESIDLIFLDLHMPELSGADFLRSVSNLPQIVITTTDTGFALDAFEFNVTDYLIKPVSLARFLKAVEKVRERLKLQLDKEQRHSDSNVKELFVTVDRKLIKINFEDILFIEASGDYIFIHTAEKKYLTHSTLKKIEEKLPRSDFAKVHRSYIANLTKITDIQDSNLVMGAKLVPISRAQREKLISRLNLL